MDRSVWALGARQVAVARQVIDIDRAKLRAAIGSSCVRQCSTCCTTPSSFRLPPIIIALLDRIDEGRETTFFADEAGVAGRRELGEGPAAVVQGPLVSATAGPEEYGQRIVRLLKHHYDRGSAKTLGVARKTATPAQQQALSRFNAAAIRPTSVR